MCVFGMLIKPLEVDNHSERTRIFLRSQENVAGPNPWNWFYNFVMQEVDSNSGTYQQNFPQLLSSELVQGVMVEQYIH